MKRKWNHKFDTIYFKNRWKEHHRGDWTIIGLHRWYHSVTEYCYRFCFFGLECHIWMKRSLINKKAHRDNLIPASGKTQIKEQEKEEDKSFIVCDCDSPEIEDNNLCKRCGGYNRNGF